eukprot:1577303-Prymnesium_polylepis.1
MRAERRRDAREALAEEQVHLTREADVAWRAAAVERVGVGAALAAARHALEAIVSVSQEEARHRRAVHEDLQHARHEARVAEVGQPAQPEELLGLDDIGRARRDRLGRRRQRGLHGARRRDGVRTATLRQGRRD